MAVVIFRAFVLSLAMLSTFAGAFLLWQLGAQPNTNGCYMLPFGFGGVIQPYQGSCAYDSLPNYFAGDIGVSLVVLGFLISLVSVRGGGKVTLG